MRYRRFTVLKYPRFGRMLVVHRQERAPRRKPTLRCAVGEVEWNAFPDLSILYTSSYYKSAIADVRHHFFPARNSFLTCSSVWVLNTFSFSSQPRRATSMPNGYNPSSSVE